MEDYRIDIRLSEGPKAQTITMPIERFTLIGATTRFGMLTPPMRARFGIEQRLNYYAPEDLELIVRRTAECSRSRSTTAGAREIARRSRGTPRVANRLLRRVRDYAQVRANGVITEDVARAGARDARRRPVRPRRHGRAHPQGDHREVRRRPGRRRRPSRPRSARTRARSRRCTSPSSSSRDSCSARRAGAWRRRWRTGISGIRRRRCRASRSRCSDRRALRGDRGAESVGSESTDSDSG